MVTFAAEWGDLTQFLIAGLSARYGAPVPVALGAIAALWSVAALAVTAGRMILASLDPRRVSQVTAAVLVVLAGFTAYSALR